LLDFDRFMGMNIVFVFMMHIHRKKKKGIDIIIKSPINRVLGQI